MPTTNAGRQIAASALGNGYAFLALHTTTGAAGANEITGGTPAYARVAPVVNNAAGTGVSTLTATFNVPAGVTVAGWSANSAASGVGTVLDGGLLAASQAFTTQGTYSLTLTITVT